VTEADSPVCRESSNKNRGLISKINQKKPRRSEVFNKKNNWCTSSSKKVQRTILMMRGM